MKEPYVDQVKAIVEDLLSDYERAVHAAADYMDDWRKRRGRVPSRSIQEAAE